MKKIFFFKFYFFPECPTYCKLEKSIYNVRYRIFTKNFIFQKIKWFKVFQKLIFFVFSDREFYADQKCSGCLFSILSIFRVTKKFL